MTRECNFEVTQDSFFGTKTWCNLGKLAKQPCKKELCPIWKIYQMMKDANEI